MLCSNAEMTTQTPIFCSLHQPHQGIQYSVPLPPSPSTCQIQNTRNNDKNDQQIVPKLFCTIETRRSDVWDRIQYRCATGQQHGTNNLPLYHAGSHQNPQIQTYLQQPGLQIFPNQKNAAKQCYGRLGPQPNPKSSKKMNALSKLTTYSMLMMAPSC